MKKHILATAVGFTLMAPMANADMLLGIYAGAQGWNTSTSGGFASENATADLDFDDKTNSSFYVALEHFVPLVPNVKLARTTLNADGDTTINTNFEFDGNTYVAGESIYTESDVTTTDIILYYELFDNDLVSFDLGINAKYIDGTFIANSNDGTTTGEQDFSGVVPMVYSRVAVGLPFTGLGAYAEGSYLSIDDHKLSDFQVALTYSLLDNIAVDMTFQLGYRDVTVDIEDLDDVYADLGYDGVFAGVEVHF